MNKRIDVFHTHIEISPYKKGEYFELEKALSKWVQITRSHGKYEPVGYFIDDDKLYLPKGINLEVLEDHFGVLATKNYEPTPYKEMSQPYEVLVDPRSEIQRSSINFLTSQENFIGNRAYCQYSLNLETAGGKTYCAIASFTKLGYKTLVIVNRSYLSDHWKSEIMKFTNIPEERIIQVSSEMMRKVIEMEVEGDVYIILHQTIQSFAKSDGWNDVNEFMSVAGIGLKIYDEAHEFINSSFVIDSYTNVRKTFYLTATMGRSNARESKIFNIMLSSSAKYNDKLEEKERKIHYHPVIYKGGLSQKYIIGMKDSHGFSSFKFIDFALYSDYSCGLENALKYALSEALEHEGQILIVSPKKESVDWIAQMVSRFIEGKTIGTIYSNNSKEVNFRNQNCDIISSTIKSCGTGFNPPNLQCIICAEPHSSKITTHQLKGRLDRFKGEDTYFYDLVDKTIPYMIQSQQEHEKFMEKVAKEIVPLYL
jgi:superfamily II DNA or RNA helicase